MHETTIHPSISECLARKGSVLLSSDSLNAIFQSHILEVNQDQILVANTIPPDYIGQFITGNHFYLQAGLTRFISGEIDSDGKNIVFRMSKFKEINDLRNQMRIPFEAHEEVMFEIVNPYDNETIIKKPIIEMSSSGLSIRTTTNSKLFEPDTVFPVMRVLISGKTYLQGEAKVVYKRAFFSHTGKQCYQIGMMFLN
jgi:hypothetical protein